MQWLLHRGLKASLAAYSEAQWLLQPGSHASLARCLRWAGDHALTCRRRQQLQLWGGRQGCGRLQGHQLWLLRRQGRLAARHPAPGAPAPFTRTKKKNTIQLPQMAKRRLYHESLVRVPRIRSHKLRNRACWTPHSQGNDAILSSCHTLCPQSTCTNASGRFRQFLTSACACAQLSYERVVKQALDKAEQEAKK